MQFSLAVCDLSPKEANKNSMLAIVSIVTSVGTGWEGGGGGWREHSLPLFNSKA
jgi:hypothetical protein